MREWLTRQEALAELNVKQQTLYAYVSRGLIERRSDPAEPRRSVYRGSDIEGLARRRSRGRRVASIAASTLSWGEPAIPTAIATVAHGELIFRGRRAVDLAESWTLEEVAALLWETSEAVSFPTVAPRGDPFQSVAGLVSDAPSMIGRSPARLAGEAASCVGMIASAFGAIGEGAMHRRLGQAWSLDPFGADCVRRALVLLADHELNPSTFATRIAASTGAAMPACILAGLATLSGPRHGGAGAALAELVEEAASTVAHAAIGRWLARGHGLPGFGHPLYPHGDPRAAALLSQVEPDPELAMIRDAVADMLDLPPNIDFALLTIARAYALPPNASLALFAVARTVGWAAHAIEQAATGATIRPRAVYQGLADPRRMDGPIRD